MIDEAERERVARELIRYRDETSAYDPEDIEWLIMEPLNGWTGWDFVTRLASLMGVDEDDDSDDETPFDESMRLVGRIDEALESGELDYFNLLCIGYQWFAVFDAVLREEGFCKRHRMWMFDNLVQGNWKRLHLTDEEERRTKAEWLEMFRDEVHYCSDRWMLDRLTRCHWLYRQAVGRYVR